MNNLICGLKIKTISFLLENGLISIATLIFLKLFFANKIYPIHSFCKGIIESYTNNNFLRFFLNSKINKNLLLNTTNSVTNSIKNTQLFNLFSLKVIWSFFRIGKFLKINSKPIGKGTVGNIKKHNFSRGPVSHGSKHIRLQGSLGSGTTPGRTLPGKRMPTSVGHKAYVAVNNKILLLNSKENFIIIKGSLPGKKKSLLFFE